MDRVEIAKHEMETLMEIANQLSDRFDNKVLTSQLRKELHNYIKFLTTRFNIIREDKDKMVQLWTTQSYKDNGLTPDVIISRGNDGKIYVSDDSLWRTIRRLDEIVRGE